MKSNKHALMPFPNVEAWFPIQQQQITWALKPLKGTIGIFFLLFLEELCFIFAKIPQKLDNFEKINAGKFFKTPKYTNGNEDKLHAKTLDDGKVTLF